MLLLVQAAGGNFHFEVDLLCALALSQGEIVFLILGGYMLTRPEAVQELPVEDLLSKLKIEQFMQQKNEKTHDILVQVESRSTLNNLHLLTQKWEKVLQPSVDQIKIFLKTS